MDSLNEEYLKRYSRVSFKQLLYYASNNFKQNLLVKLSKSRFSKKLKSHDLVMLQQKKIHDKNAGIDGFNIAPNVPSNYAELNLKELHFFEAVEIDKFDLYRSRLTRRFGISNNLTAVTKRDIKGSLSKVKFDLDTISWGNLGVLNLSKRRSGKNDLIEFVDISYIKTNESYFILKFRVTPSVLFQNHLKKILATNDAFKIQPHFLSFSQILRTKTFYSHETFINSIKWNSIDNLISDLEFQLIESLKRSIKGIFFSNQMKLPSIEYYEVKNLAEFHLDRHLSSKFERAEMFMHAGGQVEIYLPHSDDDGLGRIQVVHQSKQSVTTNTAGIETNEHERIDLHFLVKSLAFPCIFKAILRQQRVEMNVLKREIYDFIEHSSKRGIFASFLFFISNRRYIKLKLRLTRIALTMKRFESEFSKENLVIYTSEFDLSKFLPPEGHSKTRNLLQQIVKSFVYQISQLEKKKEDINSIFKSIEEVNSYRTNLLLQVISIFLGLVAFLFAFDKVKEMFSLLFGWILKLIH